jgi:hypothetical protein
MLTKLSPDKLADAWPMVYRALKSSSIALAEMTEERVNNVLRSIMSGHATCWIDERGNTVSTVIITTITEEPISKTFNLLIYCAHMFSKLKSADYIEMSRQLGTYARSLGCSRVILYSSNDKLTEIFKKSGAIGLYTLVVFPLL